MSTAVAPPSAAPNGEGLSKAQIAYTWVRERIVSGDYAPGYRLVLSTLAAELDVSVVPVREAIRQLEAEGLVNFERNVGARVAMIDESRYVESMEALGILEGAATAMALSNISEEDLVQAQELNDQLRVILEDFDPKTFTELNHRFHNVLTCRCPNERLIELVNAEWEKLGHLRESTFSFVPGRAAESVAEHQRILDLIENRAAPAQVEAAVREHRAATLASYLAAHPNHP